MTTVRSDPEVPPYQGLAAHYDELFGEQSAQDRLDLFEWIVDKYEIRFNSAADVGCGTGTFVKFLLRSGVQSVWGVDLSPAMLVQAIAKNPQNEARFLRQDLRELRLPEEVDLLTCQFETLNYLLTDEDLRLAFTGFAAALAPGGHAVFDVAAQRPGGPESDNSVVESQFADHAVTIRARYDTKKLVQVASVRVTGSVPSGPVATATATASETHIQRFHTIDDVITAMQGSGLVVRAVLDSTDVELSAQQAENVTFLAQRTQLAADMPRSPGC